MEPLNISQPTIHLREIERQDYALLTLTYYPEQSRSTGAVLGTCGTSLLTSAGGDLVLEFLPDVASRLRF